MKERTIEEIRKKIKEGTAQVMTAEELKQLTLRGEKVSFDDVDVVTTATRALMSGTMAIMAFRLTEAGKYIKFKSAEINGIQCYVGPCPNEYLGLIDLIIYATDKSKENPNYGAGHLFRDLVEHKKVHVKAETVEGAIIEKDITIDDIYFAQEVGVRNVFRNYNVFVNPSSKPVTKSIFTVLPMLPDERGATLCGSGVINPIENDPQLDIIGIGTPILYNGSIGYVIGSGTRSSNARPNLMTKASMFDMMPEYMGGFLTSNGPEVINTIGLALPIINEKVFNNLKLIDKNVPLSLVDIVGRRVLTTLNYGQVWKKDNYDVLLDPNYLQDYCNTCKYKDNCPVERMCPTKAFSLSRGIDKTRCFNCGTCTVVCPKHAFKGDLGEVEYNGKKIPIRLRESDRRGAIKMMNQLKKLVLKGEFPITLPVARLKIYVEKEENKREQLK
ncbi:MAG: methanogenesis marker 16 metalloprotein [Promethearchaeota archaeon]